MYELTWHCVTKTHTKESTFNMYFYWRKNEQYIQEKAVWGFNSKNVNNPMGHIWLVDKYTVQQRLRKQTVNIILFYIINIHNLK